MRNVAELSSYVTARVALLPGAFIQNEPHIIPAEQLPLDPPRAATTPRRRAA
jgi:hypothetical protein